MLASPIFSKEGDVKLLTAGMCMLLMACGSTADVGEPTPDNSDAATARGDTSRGGTAEEIQSAPDLSDAGASSDATPEVVETSEDSTVVADSATPDTSLIEDTSPTEDSVTSQDITAPDDVVSTVDTSPIDDTEGPTDVATTEDSGTADTATPSDTTEADDIDLGPTDVDTSSGQDDAQGAADVASTDTSLPDDIEDVQGSFEVQACLQTEVSVGAACNTDLSVAFDEIVLGDTVTVVVQLTNVGDTSALLTSVDASTETIVTNVLEGEVAVTLPCPIDTGAPLRVSITLAAVVPGPVTETVSIAVAGDSDATEFIVTLSGQVSGCPAGTADCDADLSNGCETNTQTSLTHCGQCASPCSVDQGSATCEAGQCAIVCDAGFSGDGATCDDIDECDGAPCAEHATCDNTPGAYTCTCDAGFSGDGATCDDIDECDGAPCAEHATCDNTPGAYTCTCDAGFTGDGATCDDIDECDGAPCAASATCDNTPGAYTCTCNSGFSEDGLTCKDINECTDGSEPCDAMASCTNTKGSYTCTCGAGYAGDGLSCEDVDECVEGLSECDPNAACANTPGTYECSCLEGFAGDGMTCSEITVGTLSVTLDVEVAIPGACVHGEVTAEGSSEPLETIALEATGGEVFADSDCTTPIEAPFLGGDVWLQGSEAGQVTLSASAPWHAPGSGSLTLHGDHFADDQRSEATLVIYNANDPDAYDVAQYYAASRDINVEHLCPVSLPRGMYATPDELLGARASVIEDCFCSLLGAGAPTPCDVSTLPVILQSLPITHLAMMRGLPARLHGTVWTSDFENPSFDFYFSVLLAQDLPLFEAGTSGQHTLSYPYVTSALTSSPPIHPADHGYFALSRVEAITPERTLALIDRTLTSEAHGLAGNILSESVITASDSKNPGRALTSSYAPECSDYLSHEPFVFGSEESTWPYETCRWGTTGSDAEGSARQLMPGMNNTTVPRAINVAFFNGGEPFSQPVDNNHSAFYNYNTMLNWRKSDAECTPECADLPDAESIAACEESSTDFFRVLNTECVGVAPGFMGQQLRSYPVGYYGFLPPGWFGAWGGAGDKTPGTIRDDGAYNDDIHTDPYYLRIGQAGLDTPNSDECERADGSLEPCLERVAVGLRRSENVSPTLPVSGERAFVLRLRYRNQGYPGATLQLQLFVNRDNVVLRQADDTVPTIPLSESHDTWQTAEFEVVASEEDYAEIDHASLQLNGNLNRKIRGFIDLDAIECLDAETGANLLQQAPLSFAWVQDRSNLLGESAADVIDRMNGIAYWGSSSHHLTGGWSFHSYNVATMLFSTRTLGEATAYSGAKAGLVYGDPLYRGYGVAIHSDDRYKLDTGNPRQLWTNTPPVKLPYLTALNGTDHALTLTWHLDYCMEGDKVACEESDGWTPLMRGQGAIRNLPLDLDAIHEAVGAEAVMVRLRAWRPSDPVQHLSAYAYLQVMGVEHVIPEACIYDLNVDGFVNGSDLNLATSYQICTEEALAYDADGDGILNITDLLHAVVNPDEVDLELFDFNGDGVLDFDDLDPMLTALAPWFCGLTLQDGSFPPAYDVNGDGSVDHADLLLIEAANGTTGCPCDSPSCSP
jgi:hypothetical protein